MKANTERKETIADVCERIEETINSIVDESLHRQKPAVVAEALAELQRIGVAMAGVLAKLEQATSVVRAARPFTKSKLRIRRMDIDD